MGKLILLLFVGLIAYLVIKAYARSARLRRRDEAPPRVTERMVVCDHCGVHLPESEAVESAGRRYCCEEHRRLAES